jgi:hypothetical protein
VVGGKVINHVVVWRKKCKETLLNEGLAFVSYFGDSRRDS